MPRPLQRTSHTHEQAQPINPITKLAKFKKLTITMKQGTHLKIQGQNIVSVRSKTTNSNSYEKVCLLGDLEPKFENSGRYNHSTNMCDLSILNLSPADEKDFEIDGDGALTYLELNVMSGCFKPTSDTYKNGIVTIVDGELIFKGEKSNDRLECNQSAKSIVAIVKQHDILIFKNYNNAHEEHKDIKIIQSRDTHLGMDDVLLDENRLEIHIPADIHTGNLAVINDANQTLLFEISFLVRKIGCFATTAFNTTFEVSLDTANTHNFLLYQVECRRGLIEPYALFHTAPIRLNLEAHEYTDAIILYSDNDNTTTMLLSVFGHALHSGVSTDTVSDRQLVHLEPPFPNGFIVLIRHALNTLHENAFFYTTVHTRQAATPPPYALKCYKRLYNCASCKRLQDYKGLSTDTVGHCYMPAYSPAPDATLTIHLPAENIQIRFNCSHASVRAVDYVDENDGNAVITEQRNDSTRHKLSFGVADGMPAVELPARHRLAYIRVWLADGHKDVHLQYTHYDVHLQYMQPGSNHSSHGSATFVIGGAACSDDDDDYYDSTLTMPAFTHTHAQTAVPRVPVGAGKKMPHASPPWTKRTLILHAFYALLSVAFFLSAFLIACRVKTHCSRSKMPARSHLHGVVNYDFELPLRVAARV